MSMYRREHAGFDYELWLRRGHKGTPDDFLEWLRGPKGDPADADSIEVDNLTPEARARLEGAYLSVANERPFGSIEIPNTHTLQGFCSFSGNGAEYVVFAYAKGLTQKTAAQYAAAEIPANHETHLVRYNLTQDRVDTIVVPTKDSPGDRGGHYNDMTYCPDNGRIYVANYSLPRIEVFNTALDWLDSIDLSGYGVDHAGIHVDNDITKQRKFQPGCPNGIAWSEKEKCFYVNFRDISAAGGTSGMFRFSADFSKSEQFDFANGSYNRQGLYVERDTGNIMSIKFRRSRSFRYPPGNRIHIHDRTGRLIAVTHVDCEREIEGICELSDGHYLFGFYAKNGTKKAAMFTVGVISSGGGTSLYSRWSKAYLNTSDYNNNTNNIYYAETGHTIAVGDGIAETGAKAVPFRTWASLLNFLKSNTTETLNIHLLTDLLWPLNISFYDRNISFIGEAASAPEDDEESGEGDETTPDDPDEGESDGSALRSIPQVSLYRCQSNIRFDTLNVGATSLALTRNRSVFFYGCTAAAVNGVQWNDNDMLSFEACDLTGVSDVDLLRTRLVLLKNITAYGTATRFHGVGTSYRIYGNTTADEQYVLRGQPSATPNIVCSELTRISQIRMDMNMNVSTVTAGKMTDIPFWLRNGDWDNGTATCSTAGNVSEKAITVAGISALTDGLEFLITFTHANTYDGDLTLNLNGLGAVPLLFGDWTDGEQVCVKYYAPDPTAGTAARFVRYGLSFTGRAEVLSNDAMLYVIQHGGEEYRRVVEFGSISSEDTRTLRIISDSGWQTRDDEIYPINTVVRPEAMADNWAGRRVVVFGDSITNWSHGGYWTNYLVSEAGCAVTNRSVSGAGFARGVNTIIGQLGTKATVTESGLTATALYGGLWGNGLTYTIAEADDTFTVTVSLDGQVVLTYTGLATIGDLKTASSGNGYLTFDGTDATALVAGESIALDGAELVESGLFDGAAAVIVAAGTNDANSTETASTIRAAIQTVIDTVKANTAAPIIFITPIRRSHDSSGGTGTETYSRQRLVGAAICNVAVLNNCSVVNGYDFPIATTGTEWVTDMTLDGLHPEAAGKNVYAHSFLSAVGYSFREKKSIKVLGIGNSHTRDALRYLYEILAHSGYNAVVGHYMWGGSYLYQQYNALTGKAGQSFPTNPAPPAEQLYFYRKYSAEGNGANHSHDYPNKNLADAIADERWDVVIFQNQTVACAEYWEYFPPTDPTDPHYPSYYPASDYNIDVFAAEVKKRIGNPDLLIGLMAPHTRAYDYAGDEIDGVTYTPALLDDMIQENIAKVAKDMAQCNLIVNTGLAIKYARAIAELDALGHDMTRIDTDGNDNVHLEYGIPMYTASMTFAMAICGDNMGLVPWVPPVASFSASRAYGEGDVREYSGTIYRKNVTTGAEAWNAAHWDEYDHSPLAYRAKLCARRAVFPRGEHDIGDGPRFYFPDLSAAPVAQSISLVTCEGKAALFDTGASNSWSIIKDYLDGLMAEGAFSGIDVIFISHYHGDHVGNFANILDNYAKPNCHVYLPPSPLTHFPTDYTASHYTDTIAKLENDGIAYTIVTREMTVPVGEMAVELFNTTDEDYAYYDALELDIHNNYSMCALVRYGNTYALYPGDIQSAAQTRIMSQHQLPRLWLYVVHHHGVHGADPAGFFEMLAPEYAVISISYGRFMELSSSGRKPGKYFADHLGSTAYGEYRYACDQSGGIILKGRDIQKVGVGDDVRTLYVNNEYTGTIHDGTDAHPFTQIQEALLFVQEGEYRSWVINIKATDTTYEFVRFFDYPGYIRLVGNASDKALGKYPHVDGAHFSQMATLKLQDLIFDGEGSEDGGTNSMLHFVNSCVTLSNCTIDGGNSSLSSMMGVRAFACYNVFISGGTRFKDLRTGVITTQGSEVFANGAVFENMGLCCYAVNAMNLTIRVADDISNVGSGKYLYTNGSGAPSRLMFVPNTMTAAKAALCTSTVVSQPFYLDSTNVICVLANSKIYNLLTGAEVTP